MIKCFGNLSSDNASLYHSRSKRMQDVMTSSVSSSIDYPPGPHSILPNQLLRRFLHDPIKTLMEITRTYGDISHFKFGRRGAYLPTQ